MRSHTDEVLQIAACQKGAVNAGNTVRRHGEEYTVFSIFADKNFTAFVQMYNEEDEEAVVRATKVSLKEPHRPLPSLTEPLSDAQSVQVCLVNLQLNLLKISTRSANRQSSFELTAYTKPIGTILGFPNGIYDLFCF